MTDPHRPWPLPEPGQPDPDEFAGDAAENSTDGDPQYRPPESPWRHP